jgi:transcriptional regulator with XRE-family HTH domain
MTAKTKLLEALPYDVEKSLKRLGADLRTARLRRNLSAEQLGEKIGVGRNVINDAEKGKPSTSIAIYTAMMWALNLLNQLDEVALPEKDSEGQVLSFARDRERARTKTGLSNDF